MSVAQFAGKKTKTFSFFRGWIPPRHSAIERFKSLVHGQNADWDGWLYQDTRTRERVICKADGPGCLLNFVVH